MQQPRSMNASMQFYDARIRRPSYLQMPFAEQNAYLKNLNFRACHEAVRNAGFPMSDEESAFSIARDQREIALGTYNQPLQHVIPRHNYGKSRL